MTQLRGTPTGKKNPNASLEAVLVMPALEADGKCDGWHVRARDLPSTSSNDMDVTTPRPQGHLPLGHRSWRLCVVRRRRVCLRRMRFSGWICLMQEASPATWQVASARETAGADLGHVRFPEPRHLLPILAGSL